MPDHDDPGALERPDRCSRHQDEDAYRCAACLEAQRNNPVPVPASPSGVAAFVDAVEKLELHHHPRAVIGTWAGPVATAAIAEHAALEEARSRAAQFGRIITVGRTARALGELWRWSALGKNPRTRDCMARTHEGIDRSTVVVDDARLCELASELNPVERQLVLVARAIYAQMPLVLADVTHTLADDDLADVHRALGALWGVR